MARQLRDDQPGATFHVMNRGSARRTIFDTPADYRFFLAGMARAVRRQEIVVLAYALMRTHFHLYVRSLGGLSTAMRRIQLCHVRRFNRLHRRDGPLLRNRFLSKRVSADANARNVVLYIHENPVLARLCERPEQYRWSSAWLGYQKRQPLWFSMEALDRFQIGTLHSGRPCDDERMHARAELVETRLRARGAAREMPLDAMTPAAVLDWMHRKARLADGAVSDVPLVGASTLGAVLESRLGSVAATCTPVPGAGTYPTHDLLLAGLLRDVCCCSLREIASKLQRASAHAGRLVHLHRRCLLHLPTYAALAEAIVRDGVEFLDRLDD